MPCSDILLSLPDVLLQTGTAVRQEVLYLPVSMNLGFLVRFVFQIVVQHFSPLHPAVQFALYAAVQSLNILRVTWTQRDLPSAGAEVPFSLAESVGGVSNMAKD